MKIDEILRVSSQDFPIEYVEKLLKLATDSKRYTWVLEKNDYYPEHSILIEGRLLLPPSNRWFNFKL